MTQDCRIIGTPENHMAPLWASPVRGQGTGTVCMKPLGHTGPHTHEEPHRQKKCTDKCRIGRHEGA